MNGIWILLGQVKTDYYYNLRTLKMAIIKFQKLETLFELLLNNPFLRNSILSKSIFEEASEASFTFCKSWEQQSEKLRNLIMSYFLLIVGLQQVRLQKQLEINNERINFFQKNNIKFFCSIEQCVITQKTILYKIDMENVDFKLFKMISTELPSQFVEHPPCLIGAFSVGQDQEPCLSLSLYKTTLLLKDHLKNYHTLQLQFAIKLQILHLQDKNVRSEVIGFNLSSQSDENISFYGSDSAKFALYLAKILNMKGFHDIFRPIKKLGRGNFATVYQAERITDHQRFAVKAFSKPNSYSAKNGKESLMNELSLLRSLNVQPHPNVLRLEAVYQSQNSIYVVLQLLEGQTLLEKMQGKSQNLLSDKDIKTIIRGLLKGIAHLVKNRVMHRDLKPQNIMIRQYSMQPVIVDFGLATNVDLPQYLFFRCGTPGYVAPQIIMLTESVHLEPTCDMFSLGAIFHYLLTNKPLFAGTKYDQVYKSNKQCKISLQSQAFQSVGPNALDLLSKMLLTDSSLRITPSAALLHPYFNDLFQQCVRTPFTSKTLDSTTNTENSVRSADKKKKKRFFFF